MKSKLMSLIAALMTTVIATLCIAFATQADVLIINTSDTKTGRPIGQASIQLTDRQGSLYSSETNQSGEARIESLKRGLYDLVVSGQGYDSQRFPSVRIVDDKVTRINATLSRATLEMEQVLVIGQGLSGDGLDPASSSYLDRESLRSSAGSGSDVLRALDGLPGLFSDGEFSSFTVRGNGPRNNLILVDGIPFDRVVHFSGSFGELDEVESGGRFSVFAPNIIGGAEFQPGGWSAAYGGQAGSLLKLEVAEGNPETPSYTARLDIAGIEIGYDGPSRFHDDTTVLFSARQLNFERVFELVGEDDSGAPELTDVILKTSTQLSETDELNVLMLYAPETFSRTAENALASDEDEPGNWTDLELNESETDNTLLSVTWNKFIGDNAELTNQFYFRDYSEVSEQGEAEPFLVDFADLSSLPDDQVPRRFPIITSQNDEREIGWRLDLAFDNTLGRLQGGIRLSETDLFLSRSLDNDWIRYEYEQNDFRPDTDQKFIVLRPETFDTRLENTARRSVAYLEQNLSMGAIDLRLGGRVEHDNLLDDTLVSPRLAANWQNEKGLSVTLTAGRYSQSPTFTEIASDPNNNLGYQVNDQVSLGFKYRFESDIEVFVEPYYQKLSDLVVDVDGVDQTLANTGEGRGYGLDMAITRYFKNGWSANATYSFNETQLKDNPNGLEYDADYNRPHAFTVGGIWEINDRWKVSSRFKWASGLPFDNAIIHENVLGDGELLRYSREFISNNTERYDSFSSLNVRVDYQRHFGSVDLIAFLDIINLLGSENPSESEFNERTGRIEAEEGETLPLFGFRFLW